MPVLTSTMIHYTSPTFESYLRNLDQVAASRVSVITLTLQSAPRPNSISTIVFDFDQSLVKGRSCSMKSSATYGAKSDGAFGLLMDSGTHSCGYQWWFGSISRLFSCYQSWTLFGEFQRSRAT